MRIERLLPSLIFLSAVVTAASSASGQTRKINYQTQGQNRATAVTDSPEAYLCEAVDEQPQFPGGDTALLRYINSERRYPAEAYRRQIQGRVLCGFVIDTDGAIGRVDIIRGVDDNLNREAMRIIQKMPRWTAGRIGTTRVPVYYILPIPFRL
ncbi:MAG: energy transducer TonB [Muribaculaceae bacterium]|nr:energy transducer TonB [Muribaculaceae bacterium]